MDSIGKIKKLKFSPGKSSVDRISLYTGHFRYLYHVNKRFDLNLSLKDIGISLLFAGLFFCALPVAANSIPGLFKNDNYSTSTQEEAIKFIDSIKVIPASNLWPNINPIPFLQNLKINIHQPLSMYPGIGTNFCGYGALIYLLLDDDPVGYARFMLALYKDGKATMGEATFEPSEIIKKTAGTLKYKGVFILCSILYSNLF